MKAQLRLTRLGLALVLLTGPVVGFVTADQCWWGSCFHQVEAK